MLHTSSFPQERKKKQKISGKSLYHSHEFIRHCINTLPERSQTSENNVCNGTSIFCVRNSLLIFFPPLQVQDTSFILCIVVIQPEVPVKQLKNLNTVPSSKLLYHRLDLLGQPSACLHFKQLATLGKARGLSAWS